MLDTDATHFILFITFTSMTFGQFRWPVCWQLARCRNFFGPFLWGPCSAEHADCWTCLNPPLQQIVEAQKCSVAVVLICSLCLKANNRTHVTTIRENSRFRVWDWFTIRCLVAHPTTLARGPPCLYDPCSASWNKKFFSVINYWFYNWYYVCVCCVNSEEEEEEEWVICLILHSTQLCDAKKYNENSEN